jgi:UDP-N-acetylmuramoylalanine--D-glutamate ligase
MMYLPSLLEPCRSRPAAVFGLGVSGQAALELLHQAGFECDGFDEVRGRVFTQDDASRYGLVVYSPGFHPLHPWLEWANESGCFCLAELDLAALFWQRPIIAVTGTNGKSTLTQFLGNALNDQGLMAVATGNIGYAFSQLCLDEKKRDCIAVCEISSFQAEALSHLNADALLWTNFGEDHLDRYMSLKAYFYAKFQLIHCLRRPLCFVGRSVAEAAGEYGLTLPAYVDVVDPASEPLPGRGVFASGPHRENYVLARRFAAREKMDLGQLEALATEFIHLPHRLHDLGMIRGVRFWDDSKATNFPATLAALDTFEAPVHWIGGGKRKGGDVLTFTKNIASKIKSGYLIGETREEIHAALSRENVASECFESLASATEAAFNAAQPGEHVVLCPGFSSLDQFENYAHRGISFKNIVLSLNLTVKQ